MNSKQPNSPAKYLKTEEPRPGVRRLKRATALLIAVELFVLYGAFKGFFWLVAMAGFNLGLGQQLMTWYTLGFTLAMAGTLRFRGGRTTAEDWCSAIVYSLFWGFVGPLALLVAL